jgi:hypothetical protein
MQDSREGDQSCASGQPIWAYCPESLKGSIVITSRSRQMVSRMVEDSDIIIVEPMDETHAIALFEKKLEAHAQKENIIQRLCKQQPISRKGRHASQFPNIWKPFGRVIIRRSVSLIMKDGTSAETGKPKTPFLSLGKRLSTLHADNTNDSGGQDNNASESSVVEIFQDDILMLRDYAIMTICPDETYFEMHRLVQLAMQEWLKTKQARTISKVASTTRDIIILRL